jgi:hypothetical protein
MSTSFADPPFACPPDGLIPYAGFEPRIVSFGDQCLAIFECGFDTVFIARVMGAHEAKVESAIWAARESAKECST